MNKDETSAMPPADPWAAAAASKSTAAKRPHVEGDCSGAGDSSGAEDWETKLAECVHAGIATALPSACSKMGEDVIQKVPGMLRPIHKKLDHHGSQIDGLGARMVAQENEIKQLRKEVADVRTLVAVEDSEPLATRGVQQRDPDMFDKTLVRISAQNLVSLEACKAVVAELLAEVCIDPGMVEYKGPDIGKNFRVVFTGEPNTAGRRASKFLGILHGDNGWRETRVDRPTGGKERIFFNPDRSDKEIKRATATHKLAALVQEDKLSIKCHKSKRDGTISFNWQKLAQLNDASDAVVWEPAALENGLDTKEIDKHFAAYIAKRRL